MMEAQIKELRFQVDTPQIQIRCRPIGLRITQPAGHFRFTFSGNGNRFGPMRKRLFYCWRKRTTEAAYYGLIILTAFFSLRIKSRKVLEVKI